MITVVLVTVQNHCSILPTHRKKTARIPPPNLTVKSSVREVCSVWCGGAYVKKSACVGVALAICVCGGMVGVGVGVGEDVCLRHYVYHDSLPVPHLTFLTISLPKPNSPPVLFHSSTSISLLSSSFLSQFLVSSTHYIPHVLSSPKTSSITFSHFLRHLFNWSGRGYGKGLKGGG